MEGTMRDYVLRLTKRLGINGLGRALGINGSSVLAWVRGESLPSADLVPLLATLGSEDAAALRTLLFRAQEERAARKRLAMIRPTPGTAAPPVAPSRKRRGPRRLRGWLLMPAAVSATLLGQPLRAASAGSYNNHHVSMEAYRDSVAYTDTRRRKVA